MRRSAAHHVWQLFYFSGREREKPTQSAVITLEILDVTMEAFVSVLNGQPGHSLILIALNQYLGFSILLAAPRGIFGTARKEISSGQALLIAFL